VESTAFDFGGGDPIVFMILSLVSGHALKKRLNLKVFVPGYLRFHRLITQLYHIYRCTATEEIVVVIVVIAQLSLQL